MKKILTMISAFVVLTISSHAIDKPIISYPDGVEPFKTVKVSANANIILKYGGEYDVNVLSGDSIIRKNFNFFVEDSTLHIREKFFDTKKPVKIVVTTPSILYTNIEANKGYVATVRNGKRSVK